MKVVLISPYSSLASLGLRHISSYLKQEGHEVSLIFLTASHEPMTDYTDRLLQEVVSLCQGAGVICISLMSGYVNQARTLTRALKSSLNIPVIWGGVHPTGEPLECLDYADIVCLGEGEEALAELVRKMEAGEEYYATRNFWFKRNGEIIQNEVRPLIANLDALPFMDFDLKGHYVYDPSDTLVPLTRDLLKERLISEETLFPGTAAYQTIWARGCPYKCTYCCNDIFHSIYKGQKLVRKKSAQRIIDELRHIRQQFDFVTNIWFHDDSFFATPLSELKEFSDAYRKAINLPFVALGDPVFTTGEKLEVLVGAGLHTLQVGIQSGSAHTIDLYNRRHFKPEKTVGLGETINRFTDRIQVRYDIITDNPYETDNDTLDTIRMLLKIPYPYKLQIFSLAFFPGTELYRRAKKDGFIRDEEEIYRKQYFKIKPTYLNFVLKLLAINFSKKTIEAMITPGALSMLNRQWFGTVLFIVAKAMKIPLYILKKIAGKT